MREKFGLEFRVVDSALMKQLRRERGHPIVNLPGPTSHRLINHRFDFLKRERPFASSA